MPEVESTTGMFTWADLSTTDPAGAQAFYAGVLGWEYEEIPAGEHGMYTLCRKDGKDVAGMGKQPEHEVEAGIPPMWSSHVLVDDVDALTGRVPELGGYVVLEPMDVMEAGRMSIVRDPSGGMLCLWEPRSHRGADLFNEHGAMAWNELATRDREAAVAFYGELLGWEFEGMESPGGPYELIRNRGRMNGGVLQMTEEWPDEIPPHWMVYFWVDDVETAAERVRELGGSVSVEPFDIGVGTMSVVSDPQGAVFTLFNGQDGPSA